MFLPQSQKAKYIPTLVNNGSRQRNSLLNDPTDPESVLNPDMNIQSIIKRSSLRMKALITKNFVRLKRNIP